MKNRVVILLMDSFGIGASKDAKDFGDAGADTLGSIVDYCVDTRTQPLSLPNLYHRGLQHASELSRQKRLSHTLSNIQANTQNIPQALYGYAAEISKGKDTPSGHWEMIGAPVMSDWHYFVAVDEKESCFPEAFMTRFIAEAGIEQGVLDAGHASGTEVLKALGDEHCQYLSTAQDLLGEAYISNNTFRFGASELLDNLLGNEIVAKHY
jgi:phosphopentomutase